MSTLEFYVSHNNSDKDRCYHIPDISPVSQTDRYLFCSSRMSSTIHLLFHDACTVGEA